MCERALNSTEQRTFRAARYAALRSLEYTIRQLNNGDDSVAKVWLAVEHPKDLKELARRLKKIFEALQGIHENLITYKPKGRWYAEVDEHDTSHAITLGARFFETDTYGHNSRAGTLIHEISHFTDVLATDDHAYGAEACLRLVRKAEQDDEKFQEVLSNADNWEYLVERTF